MYGTKLKKNPSVVTNAGALHLGKVVGPGLRFSYQTSGTSRNPLPVKGLRATYRPIAMPGGGATPSHDPLSEGAEWRCDPLALHPTPSHCIATILPARSANRHPGKRYRFGPHRTTAAVLVCAAMGERNSPETPSLELRIGRLLFALSVVASGIYQLLTGRYVNLVPANPARLPPPWQPYLFGVLFVLIGVALLMRRTVSVAAITLAALLLVLFFGFGLPVALAHASTGYVRVDPLMMLALLGGVTLAAAPRDRSPPNSIGRFFETATRLVPW